MNAAPRSVVSAQRHQSRKLDASSREMRARAVSSTVTNLPSKTAKHKVERLNADARLRMSGSLEAIANKPNRNQSSVHSLGTSPTLTLSRQATPAWLSLLIVLRRSSDLIAFLLVAATLTIYSWTVYTQQQWAKEYRKLETLQRHERNLTTANETMKNQLAQQAEKPATGLVNPTPANTIFLPQAPQRQASPVSHQTTEPNSAAKSPLGVLSCYLMVRIMSRFAAVTSNEL